MRSLVIGGNSRNVGKTGLAVSIISACRDLDWTAVKITQFGHGVCSQSGGPCGCAVSDPKCPYEIEEEGGLVPTTDTARMLAAGASRVLWVRVALGRLAEAVPAIRNRLEGTETVLFESNSIVDHWKANAYVSVLQREVDDCKVSAKRLAPAADAFVLPPASLAVPEWDGFANELLDERPVFHVEPPSFCSDALVKFVRDRMLSGSATVQ